MRLGNNNGFLCDFCSKPLSFYEEYEVCFRKYIANEEYSIVNTAKSTSVCAYNFCEDCFKLVSKSFKNHDINLGHNPALKLEKNYSKLKARMEYLKKQKRSMKG